MHARVAADISCQPSAGVCRAGQPERSWQLGQLIQDAVQQVLPYCLQGKCSCRCSDIQDACSMTTSKDGLLRLQRKCSCQGSGLEDV